ncbi:MAG: hypothetical protein FWC03_12900, partial [Treponema sp.]|nr:hypothetical protein [Treponema sp.]
RLKIALNSYSQCEIEAVKFPFLVRIIPKLGAPLQPYRQINQCDYLPQSGTSQKEFFYEEHF